MSIQTQFPATFFKSSFFPNFQNALARAASSSVDILVVGDSITEGYNATDRPTQGYVGLLRSYYQGIYGDGGYGFVPPHANSSGYPYPWTFTGSWSLASPAGPFYGPYNGVRWATGTGNTASITMTATAIDIHYARNVFTNSTWSYTVDGGSSTNVVQTSNGSTTPTYEVLSITGLSNASHTVVVTAPATNYFFLIGATAKKGTSGVRVHNLGFNGNAITGYAPDAEAPRWARSIAPDLTIIAMTTNSYAAQTALNTYQQALQWTVDTAVLDGDVMMIGANPRLPENNAIPQTSYHSRMRTVMPATGKMVDFKTLWVDNATQLAAGYSTDGVHPSDTGHAKMRDEILAVLPA